MIVDNFDYHPNNDPSQVIAGDLHSIVWQKGGSTPPNLIITTIAKERWTVRGLVKASSIVGGTCSVVAADSWMVNVDPLDTATVLFTEFSNFIPGYAVPACGDNRFDGYTQVLLYNENNVLQKTITLQTWMQDPNIIHSYEFQLIGTIIYQIRDGIVSSLGAWNGTSIGYVKFYGWAYHAAGYGSHTEVDLYIDNFATTPVIGVSADRHPDAYTTHNILDNVLDHPDDEIDVTYQLEYSPPQSYISSEYNIKVRNLIGELITETVIKPAGQDVSPTNPPFGIVKYSLANILRNYGYYNFELTKNDISIASDYVFYKFVPAAGTSIINVPDVGNVGGDINIDYTITPYQPLAYDYVIKVYDASNREIFTYNVPQSTGTVIFNTSVSPGRHTAVLYAIDKTTTISYESAYDVVNIVGTPIVGSVRFTSIPEPAEIWIDGVYTGLSTPNTITDTAQTHTYLLRKSGYVDYQGTITILANQTIDLDLIILKANEGCISFHTNPSGASIYIDDILQTVATPALICNLSLTTHTYRLVIEGYADISGTVDLSTPGQGDTIYSDMVQLGSLTITTNPPGASIYIDDVLQTVITPATIINLSLGIHSYRLTLTNYQDATGTIDIVSGLNTLSITLSILTGLLFISTDPPGASIYIDDILQQEDGEDIVSPTVLTIPVGSHTYRLTLTGYQDMTGNFDIIGGQVTELYKTLEPVVVQAGIGGGAGMFLIAGLAIGALYMASKRRMSKREYK